MIGKSMEQIELLADRVFVAVKAHIAANIHVINLRLEQFERQLLEIPAGKDGAPGKDGTDGKDADVVAIQREIETIWTRFIDSCPLPKDGLDGAKGLSGDQGEKGERGERGERGEVGEKGDPGERGADGLNAKDGAPGDRGEQGEKGINGANGLPGENGQDGQPGQDGERGEPGRDALQLDWLPAIDEAKAYPRGTLAKHRGGLVRSIRNTVPLANHTLEQAGWEVAVEGVADVGVEQGEDLRSFAIGIELTSGKAFVNKLVSPVQIYRGVFKAGTEYLVGDTVTWDGSSWCCQQTTKTEPGNGTDWRLAVKRGSPGKDGASVKGDPGLPGRNGLDLTNMAADGSKYR